VDTVARKKTPKSRVTVKAMISSRLREIRQEQFGEHGGPELARRLELPARTWYNYETGVTVPAEVLLSFIDQTGTNPLWLLNGEGPKYRRGMEDQVLSSLTPEQLIRRGLEKLEQQPNDVQVVAPENLPAESLSDFVAVGLVPVTELCRSPGTPAPAESYILAYRQWLPHPKETVSVRVEDDAMHPILPRGSVVAVDRAVTAPRQLHGKIVAACADGRPILRWLEISGRHVILRPNQQTSEHPIIAIEQPEREDSPIAGQVVWSWSRFNDT
jgi:Peptidase S24-like